MGNTPETALETFITAIREHYAAALQKTTDTDPRVERAYNKLATAFIDYDEVLFQEYNESTPFDLFDDMADDVDDFLDDDEDDDMDFEEFEYIDDEE